MTDHLPSFLVTLADGRAITVEAETEYLAKATAAVQFGMDDLPTDALVVEVQS